MLTFYIIFVIINIIICSIMTYIDYNNGIPITLKVIGVALLLIFLSILGTIFFIVCLFDGYGDVIILQKKKLK